MEMKSLFENIRHERTGVTVDAKYRCDDVPGNMVYLDVTCSFEPEFLKYKNPHFVCLVGVTARHPFMKVLRAYGPSSPFYQQPNALGQIRIDPRKNETATFDLRLNGAEPMVTILIKKLFEKGKNRIPKEGVTIYKATTIGVYAPEEDNF